MVSGAWRTQSFDGTLLQPEQLTKAGASPAPYGVKRGLMVRISHCSPSALMASNPA